MSGAAQKVVESLDDGEDITPPPEGPVTGTAPPIVPLGHADKVFYFINASGEKSDYAARDLVRLNISCLFGGDTEWLSLNFPVRNKDGEVIFGQYKAPDAAEWLMRQCKNIYNTETSVRGLGVWRRRREVLAHLGSHIWLRGVLQKAGAIVGGAIYPACNAQALPDFDHPATATDGLSLRSDFGMWSFAQDFDADLLFGWLGAALLGGFPSWRVHALVTGEAGSGKSTLGRLMMAVLGPQGKQMNDYTVPGMRQSLTNEARIVWLDEAEAPDEGQMQRMAQMISLLRKMSDDEGARVSRGGADQKAINSTVTGCVLLTAINPPALHAQDMRRILVVPVEKPSTVRPTAEIRGVVERAEKMSARFRARALIGAKRFGEAFDLYRDLLSEHGCSGRQADMFATLLAGRAVLLHDAVPTFDQALDYVKQLRHRIRLIMLDDSEAGDGLSCLNRLMDSTCDAIRDGVKRTIGQLTSSGMTPPQVPENEKLMPHGLRIIDVEGSSPLERMLFVSNDHLGLGRIFHNTPWSGGNHRASLLRLPGVRPSPKPINVGRKSRGLLIPAALLPERDRGDTFDTSHDHAPFDPFDPAPD